MKIPCFIIARDRFTMIKSMCEQVQRFDLIPVIVDNASTYTPLLDWYDKQHVYEVVKLPKCLQGEFPHRNVWNYVIKDIYEFEEKWNTPYYDISSVPDDLIPRLKYGLHSTPGTCKCGVSLSLENIHPYYPFVNQWEQQWWQEIVHIKNQVYYKGHIDTTFALYSIHKGVQLSEYDCNAPALRIGLPYTARHIPWEVDPEQYTDEDRYYFEHLSNRTVSWTQEQLEKQNEQARAILDPPADVSESSA
jgi:hypothetical protein